MPVIYNKKVEYAYTDPGVKAHTLSWAEYQALSEDDKMNGDLYFIPDKQPEGNPSRIWTKLGTDPLTTQADDVSGAVNELNSRLNIKTTLIRDLLTGTSKTISANQTTNVDIDANKTGYEPLGLAGFDIKDGNLNIINIGFISGNIVRIWVKNISSSSITIIPTVTVLYQRIS